MDLNTLWYILIGTLYTGYFILEGFDFGVGILLPFLSKEDTSRRIVINSIGPHWDGNEVWLIVAGGATFAAFPGWYATLFSGFYIPFFLLLVALIIRGVAFEFRSKIDKPLWRSIWDWSIFFGSLIPSFLWGVAFANIIRGLPIDSTYNYTGGVLNLLNPFAILGGIISTIVFTFHGSLFLTLKTADRFLLNIRRSSLQIWLPALLLVLAGILFTNFSTNFFDRNNGIGFIFALAALILLILSGILNRMEKDKPAFLLTSLVILTGMASIFISLYPNILIAYNTANNLTIYNSASGPNTLRTMTIIAGIFVPLVIAYQAWTYWVFRKRISVEKPTDTSSLEY